MRGVVYKQLQGIPGLLQTWRTQGAHAAHDDGHPDLEGHERDELLGRDEADIVGIDRPGDAGEPTARDWAGYCDTIDYEIVTRIGPRVPRRQVVS